MTSLLAPIEATPYVGGTPPGHITVSAAGVQVLIKDNLSSAVDPAVTDDSDSDYSVTSRWTNTTADREFVCLDAAVGAAVWTETTAGGAPGGSDTELQYNNDGAFGGLTNVVYNDASSVITIGFADELSGLVGSGTDIDAADLTIKVPVSTGSADPGMVIIQTTDAGTTGSTPQTLQDRFRFDGARIEVLNSGNSVFLGENAGLVDNLTNNRNVFIGSSAGVVNTAGDRNVAIGVAALGANVTGDFNVAIGDRALVAYVGNSSIAIGRNTLAASTGPGTNVAIGQRAMEDTVTGANNIAIGTLALASCLANDNVAVGASALSACTTGVDNFGLGRGAVGGLTTGDGNIGVGRGVLTALTEGDDNQAYGANAGDNITTGSLNIVFGADVLTQSATADSQITIGNLITGNATATGTTAAAGSMGIGTFAFSTGTTLGVLCFPDNTADPAPAADTACFYANDVGGTNVTPFATDEANNVEPCVPFAEAVTLGVGVTTFVADASLVTVTGDGGANTIATITGARAFAGSRVVLLFVDALVTITDDDTHAANSVDLAGAATNFVSADDTTLELIHNGTSWYEISRSVN